MSRVHWSILALGLTACGGGDYGSGVLPPPPPGSNPSLNAEVSVTSTGDGYGGTEFRFSPASTLLQRNGTVTWLNSTGVIHNVTFASVPGAPANVPNGTTSSVSRTFPTAGTFSYQCTNHASMIGQVVVQ